MEEKKEKFISGGLEPMTIKKFEIIMEQMKKCVCKIYIRGAKGTGFFLKIPYRKELMNVLVTNHHILGEDVLYHERFISISINNETSFKKLEMGNRKSYTNKIYDITIIELKEEKDIINDFLVLDQELINEINSDNLENINDLNDIYRNESIYLLNYLGGKEIVASLGLLNGISEGPEGKIKHKCSTSSGSSGSPILLLKNNNVIGVHYGYPNSGANFNFGTLLLSPIKEFQRLEWIDYKLFFEKRELDYKKKRLDLERIDPIILNNDTLYCIHSSDYILKDDLIKNKIELKSCDKLKSLILLSSCDQIMNYIISDKDLNYNLNAIGFKVYLINNNLEKFKLDEFVALLKELKIDVLILINGKNENKMDESEFELFIPTSDQEKLKTLNDKFSKISNESFQLEPKFENIKLFNSSIKAYTEFIILPESIVDEMKINFNIKEDIKPVFYFRQNDRDIIYNKNILFFGEFNKKNYLYKIEYIFEYEKEEYLIKEIPELKENIAAYMKSKTCFYFDYYNKNDNISPIFSFNKIIGYIYKYIPDFDYSKINNYTKYLSNEKLVASIYLYYFYIDFINKLNCKDSTQKKYYLVRKTIISEIQKNCDFQLINYILSQRYIKRDINNEINDLKILYNTIKTIPENVLKEFSKSPKIEKIPKNMIIDPDLLVVFNQSNNNDYTFVFNNYGIIDEKIAGFFIDFYFENKNYYLNCTLTDGKILVNYEKIYNKKEYVSTIGRYDSKNYCILNEYMLIYNEYGDYNRHNTFIKSKINKFLKEINLINGFSIIVDEKNREIGNLMKFEKIN